MRKKQLTVREVLSIVREKNLRCTETRDHYLIHRPPRVPVTLKKSDHTRPVSPKIRSALRQLLGQ